MTHFNTLPALNKPKHYGIKLSTTVTFVMELARLVVLIDSVWTTIVVIQLKGMNVCIESDIRIVQHRVVVR